MSFDFRPLLRQFRAFRRLEKENHQLRAWRDECQRFVPPGHFYSPLPHRDEIVAGFARNDFGPPFPAIDLNEAAQFERLERFARWYSEHPYVETPTAGHRYHFNNPAYGPSDALALYGMMREARPRRIVEVGSGYSSAAMLDVDQYVLGGTTHFTFIDPDASLVRSLLREEDRAHVTVIEKMVQDVPLDPFTQLQSGDILFIDSSHVSKFGSDVNRLFFHVLPALAVGVFVHIHDIAWRLEYPREWLEEGRAWNEQYLLRAFLMYNRAFRVEFFSSYLAHFKRDFLREHMPLCARGDGGQIWLRKIAAQ